MTQQVLHITFNAATLKGEQCGLIVPQSALNTVIFHSNGSLEYSIDGSRYFASICHIDTYSAASGIGPMTLQQVFAI